ncbi:hypothetical protein IFR05_001718 [Cadophora sp. M221]|nr:hypothetical protein IFR05_001718 [Cadophora sp. M221]
MNDQGSESESTPPPNNDISRLDRLEGLIATGPGQQPVQVGNQLDTPMPTPFLQVAHRAPVNPVLDLLIETSKIVREQLTSGAYQNSHEEIQALLATLPQMVCDVQEQLSVKRRSWQMSSWNVPNEKAKKWVNCEFWCLSSELSDKALDWFDSMGMESRVLHPRREFIASIPDLLENPYIRIDFATQITYYNLLYSGMLFHEDQDIEQGSYGRQIYRRILSLIPEWEKEASCTPMDFLASFFTVLYTTGTWAVKIPSVVEDPITKLGFDPLHFIVCTKITLVIMKFFELFEQEIPPDVGPRVCSLVEEINSIAVTWRLEKNIMTATDIVGRYLYVDQLFSSYVNIILICSYRPELLHIPELNERLMKAARGSLGLLVQMTKSGFKSSWQTSVRSSWLLVSYLSIYRAILQTTDPAKSVSDLDSMAWLESTLDTWSEQHEEIVALQVAIKGLNRIVHLSVESGKSSASMSPPEASPHQRGPLTPSQSLPPIHVLEQTGFRFYSQPPP